MNIKTIVTMVLCVSVATLGTTTAITTKLSEQARQELIGKYNLAPEVAHAFFDHVSDSFNHAAKHLNQESHITQRVTAADVIAHLRDSYVQRVAREFLPPQSHALYVAPQSLLPQMFDRVYRKDDQNNEIPNRELGTSYLCSHVGIADMPSMHLADTPLINIFKAMPPEMAMPIQNSLQHMRIVGDDETSKTISFPLVDEQTNTPVTFGDLRSAGCELYEQRIYQNNPILATLAQAINRIEQWFMAPRIAPNIQTLQTDAFLTDLMTAHNIPSSQITQFYNAPSTVTEGTQKTRKRRSNSTSAHKKTKRARQRDVSGDQVEEITPEQQDAQLLISLRNNNR